MMALGVVLLLAYQTFFGALYQEIGLFAAASGVGLCVGGILGVRLRLRPFRALVMGDICLVLLALAAPLVFVWVEGDAALSGKTVLLALNGLVGMLGGAQFPLAARIRIHDQAPVGGAAGRLYAVDLLGACVGAVGVSVLLVPALGFVQACLWIACVKGLSLLVLGRSRPL